MPFAVTRTPKYGPRAPQPRAWHWRLMANRRCWRASWRSAIASASPITTWGRWSTPPTSTSPRTRRS